MYPILFHGELFGHEFLIPSYGAVLLVTFSLSVGFLWLNGRSKGISAFSAWLIVTMLFASGMLGAILWDLALKGVILVCSVDPGIIGVRSGMAWFGALIAGISFGIWFIRFHGLPVLHTMDLLAWLLLLGYALGRVACLLGGCCYGKPTDMPWGIVYPEPIIEGCAPPGVHLHPTPIYCILGALVGLLLMYGLRRFLYRDGQVLILAVGLHCIGRFVEEIYRNDHQSVLLNMTLTQIVSLFGVGIVSILLSRSSRFGLWPTTHPRVTW